MNPHAKVHTLHHSFALHGLEQGTELSLMQHLFRSCIFIHLRNLSILYKCYQKKSLTQFLIKYLKMNHLITYIHKRYSRNSLVVLREAKC